MYEGVLVVPLTGKNPAWDSPSQPGTASPRMPIAPPEEDSQGFEELGETSSKWEDERWGSVGLLCPRRQVCVRLKRLRARSRACV